MTSGWDRLLQRRWMRHMPWRWQARWLTRTVERIIGDYAKAHDCTVVEARAHVRAALRDAIRDHDASTWRYELRRHDGRTDIR